ncbi:hypothetical protein G7Y89_g13850 [Cudoniella acicularis]|uniref:Uncharacterized protein n=1 Tax=Cudoniella acicularis TaxID=354080 RepID=A0A8H4R9V4_9HELO|nr:hypothetical protein G7Y89_g13850 [Cudoniella acicularis]
MLQSAGLLLLPPGDADTTSTSTSTSRFYPGSSFERLPSIRFQLIWPRDDDISYLCNLLTSPYYIYTPAQTFQQSYKQLPMRIPSTGRLERPTQQQGEGEHSLDNGPDEGDMYGDDDYSKRDSRPLSFVSSPLNEDEGTSYLDSAKTSRTRPPPSTNGNTGKKAHTSPAMMQSPRSSSFDKGQLSPSLSLRDRSPNDAANTQFPLNDIDYESNPAAVAQELSNLQALRRMSMDVGNTSDPDLPSFQGVSLMPSVAPTGDDDEDDPSRLFWVPARRRSGDQTPLSPDGIERSGSGGGLRRKKSMLSRQIDNDGGRGAVGYKDGAEQLERKKSLSTNQAPELKISDLQELDALVRDPSKAMQKLTLDTGNRQSAEGSLEDMPILPQAPGIGLRRSTRTTYRRGSLRKGERVPFSKRAGSGRGDTDGEDSPQSSPIDGRPSIGYPLTKVQSEPSTTENFSRPNRGARRLQTLQQSNLVTPTPPEKVT